MRHRTWFARIAKGRIGSREHHGQQGFRDLIRYQRRTLSLLFSKVLKTKSASAPPLRYTGSSETRSHNEAGSERLMADAWTAEWLAKLRSAGLGWAGLGGAGES
jgi:hypothetical protein